MERITLDAAWKATAAMLERAGADGGEPVALCVVDATGTVITLARMDNVPERIAAIVTGKAYTAARLRKSTAAFRRRLVEGNFTLGDFCDDKLTSLPGGVPVFDGKTCLGAVGVSGRRLEEDEELADAFAAVIVAGLG
ncbi:conserved hypothetical protein [uncultured delta proteobacterium]|uniref:Heme-binding protein n=1 Tax=uncultured delta proteobacterium TaxID=34034 RepID=A0A212KFH7_9DELT|nr:conserved hypothetical protein [uncultured delta proteobacterium]